jgi:integrase
MGKASIVEQAMSVDEIAQKEITNGKPVRQYSERERARIRNKVATRFAPRYSLYAFRHSWATRALQSGLDALTVAVLMGHNDPSTLARVYQHLSHNSDHLRKQLASVVESG